MEIRGAGTCPRAHSETQQCWGSSPNSQPRAVPRGCWGSRGLLLLQWDPAYLGYPFSLMENRCPQHRGRKEPGGSRELREACRPPGPTAPQLQSPAAMAEPWHPASPHPASQACWPSSKHPQAGLLATYHLEGVSSVGGSDLAILSRTRMGLSS